MVLLKRRTPHPVHANYREYKQYLREDFAYRCVYCDVHENEFGGPRGFAVEHFRPKSLDRFHHLESDYSNLLYGCSVCNSYKGSAWPSDDPVGDGVGRGYIDPCDHDYADHFVVDEFEIRGRSRVASYMIDRLRLNREQLRSVRRLRRREEELHRASLRLYDEVVELTDRLLASGAGTPADRERWQAERVAASDLRAEEIERWRERWLPLVELNDY